MSNKTLSIVSYITLIGWLISFFGSTDQQPRNADVVFHQKQSFGLFVSSFIFSIITQIIAASVPSVAMVLSLVSLGFLVLMIIGILNANNEKQTALPIIGGFFTDKFSFIK